MASLVCSSCAVRFAPVAAREGRLQGGAGLHQLRAPAAVGEGRLSQPLQLRLEGPGELRVVPRRPLPAEALRERLHGALQLA